MPGSGAKRQVIIKISHPLDVVAFNRIHALVEQKQNQNQMGRSKVVIALGLPWLKENYPDEFERLESDLKKMDGRWKA